MYQFYWLLIAALPALFAAELFTGSFESKVWRFDETTDLGTRWVRFTVALNLRNTDLMHQHFLDVSNPASPNYGKYVGHRELDELYGPSAADKRAVQEFFQNIPEATVTMHEHGDLLQVLAPIEHVENHLQTSLGTVSHTYNRIAQKAIRSKTDLVIPAHIASKISFVSLNAPVNHVKPRAAKSLREVEEKKSKNLSKLPNVSIIPGNEEAVVVFYPICSDNSFNNFNPPCANIGTAPDFVFSVSTYSNNVPNQVQLDTDPTVFNVRANNVFCMYNTTLPCDASTNKGLCKCYTKVNTIYHASAPYISVISRFSMCLFFFFNIFLL